MSSNSPGSHEDGPGAGEGGPGRLILEEPAPGVARLVISNPGKRGALDQAILDAFAGMLPQLDARCLIITGEGTTFSSGYDIGDLDGPGSRRFADEAENLVAHPYTAALAAIESYPYPTVAALNGHAIGGGLEIALSCDLRIAVGTITLGMPPARLGLVYSHTGIRKFIDTIGAPRTRELFLTARRIDGRTARAWGLVNELSEAGRLADDALKLAVKIAGHAPLAQTGNKRVIGAVLAARGQMDPDVERELVELRRACFASEDFREAVEAFAQKRPPDWQGR
ncbi:MAG TPA: enoyl-CoA hydratase-related protein [Solirubrobacteraceae bacterium]|nr:enoyl-CoA hydratase-related protein [Solirubrobacteraceae bacterium]